LFHFITIYIKLLQDLRFASHSLIGLSYLILHNSISSLVTVQMVW